MASFRVERKNEPAFDVELSQDPFSIGRSSANHLSFNDQWLSRQHARITKKGDSHYIEDVGSRNGTYVNGAALTRAHCLSDGDVVQLGEIRLTFVDPTTRSVELAELPTPLPRESTIILDSGKLDFQAYSAESSGERARDEHDLWPALNQAAAALITHYELPELVEQIMDIAFKAVPAERGALLLKREDGSGELEPKVFRSARPGGPHLVISRTILDEVMSNRSAVLTLDVASDDRFVSSESLQLQGIRSVLCVPLWSDKEVIGALYVDTLLSEHGFRERDLRLLGLIANMAAVKIENARLLEARFEQKRLEEQLAVAAQIQMNLLPSANPELPNYEVTGTTQSCYEIGGDYFDFIEKADGRWALVIADVAGKGVGAALLMASVQASLRTLVHWESSPEALMTRLNQVIYKNSPRNKFVTIFYAELDPVTHALEYVNAGHNPPLLFGEAGYRLLEATGPVVGLLKDASYTSKAIEIGKDELLFMYTDGITECLSPEEEEFGIEGLVRLLESQRQSAVEGLPQLIERELAQYSRSEACLDDTTFIALRRVS